MGEQMRGLFVLLAGLTWSGMAHAAPPAATQGYYRFPALHGETLIFTAQGDLWKVNVKGGMAQALTTHPGQETNAALSPDGNTIAYSATYEGPQEIYTMPVNGGAPTRLTYEGDTCRVVGWTPDGKILYATNYYSTLPDIRLCSLDPVTRARTELPLHQASDGAYDPKTGTLFFTRQAFQGSYTKRYQGGTAQNLWKFAPGMNEAAPLTDKWAGTSKSPMVWNGRIYFASDRDGVMNLWSMDSNGGSLKQHTRHKDYDVQSPALSNGRIVYQMGADLWLYDIGANTDKRLDIAISSDEDQTREKWITNPLPYVTNVSFAPDGTRIALTARGQVAVVPTKAGRVVEAARKSGVGYRDAVFSADGKTVFVLADETKETEWWRLPVNGVGASEQLSKDANVLRRTGVPSPDGKWLAYTDKNDELWLFDLASRQSKRIQKSMDGEFADLSWSPDSRYLAYVMPTQTFARIVLHSVADGKNTPITSERVDSYSPAWSPDGKWLYFLSDRHFQSLVPAPWGPRQPEPFFDRQTKIYQIALTKGLRSPFLPADELHPVSSEPSAKPTTPAASSVTVNIDMDGIERRLYEVPVPNGNYDALTVNDTRLFWISRETTVQRKANFMTLDIGNADITPKTLLADMTSYTLSQDGKNLLLRKGDTFYAVPASSPAPASLEKKNVDLSGWTIRLAPRDEWRQMFTEAWRLERDYFYDPKLHGVDWNAVHARYLPLVDRVRDRAELSDLLGQMVGELSTLHIYVRGGDLRQGQDNVGVGSLGATWTPDKASGGYRVTHIYKGDPDYPTTLSPLAKPEVDVQEGDTVLSINGVGVLDVADPAMLLRNQAGKQTLLRIRDGKTGKERETVATPITSGQLSNLRYTDWELSRRQQVETQSAGTVGYVHLRAMGSGDIAQWARDFYPVFNRQGLIIDVRHNRGGNIDSWILEKLLRRAWFYWQPRVGNPYSNMQWAFRGHAVVLCDEWTASDGEAFAEGFRRLGIGKVIGTRTWGGEIWLSFNNPLVDNGIATAAQSGVFSPEGKWLIEGHGVEPDIVIDNLPHATYRGKDAQLEAALAYLQKQIKEKPVSTPVAPPYPNKAK
jgi:tricorn protease